MLKRFFRFFLVSAVLGALLLVALWFFLPKLGYAFMPIFIHYAVFSYVLTQISYFTVLYIHKRNKNHTGFAFLGLVLIKMAIAAIYIIPQLKAQQEIKFFLMFGFFGLYFFYLFLEARALMVLLNNQVYNSAETIKTDKE